MYQVGCLQCTRSISIYGYDDNVSRFDRGLVSDDQPAYPSQHVLSAARHTCRKNGQHQHSNTKPVPAPELKSQSSATRNWVGTLDSKRIAHQERINTPEQFAGLTVLYAMRRHFQAVHNVQSKADERSICISRWMAQN
jgi:hypothetical protein